MLRSFEIAVHAQTMDEAQEELDEHTSKILAVVGEGPWECIEDGVMPDPAWVPGIGFYGEVRGHKGWRHFVNRAE